jgi:aminoglycoside phosphotransferase
MWQEILADMVGQFEASQYTVIKVAETGASGPPVVIVRDKRTGRAYAVKYGETRVPLREQAHNSKVISQLFGGKTPRVSLSGEKLLMMEAVNGSTLHRAVVNGMLNQDELVDIFSSVLDAFCEVWDMTSQEYSPELKLRREPTSRAKKINNLLGYYIDAEVGDTENLEINLNGIQLGPIRRLLARAVDEFLAPSRYVVCHGDPNADNIMVDHHGRWWLIDWEWLGLHDWRVMISHLMGWWISNASFLSDAPQVRRSGNTLDLTYKIELHPLVPRFLEIAWEKARSLAHKWGEPDFEKQINLQIGILLLGDIRFVEARDRVPYKLVLLGEGLRFLANAG